jgi:hypothetical protein
MKIYYSDIAPYLDVGKKTASKKVQFYLIKFPFNAPWMDSSADWHWMTPAGERGERNQDPNAGR